MALFKLDDVFTYQDANEIKTLWASNTDPATRQGNTVADGEIWLDTATAPIYKLKRYNGTTQAWETISGYTPVELRDQVDDYFIRKDVNDTFAGTLSSSKSTGTVFSFDSGHSLVTVHDGYGNLNLKCGVDADHLVTVTPGGAHIQMTESGYIKLSITQKPVGSLFTDDLYLVVGQEGVRINNNLIWHAGNDGTGSDLDADKVDGLHSTQFVRSDADTDVNANIRWLDGKNARFGSSSDLTITHNNNESRIQNNTGILYVGNSDPGKDITITARNSSSVDKTLLNLKPDKPSVVCAGALVSKINSAVIANNEIFDTGIARDSAGFLFFKHYNVSHINGSIYMIGMNMALDNGVVFLSGSSAYHGNVKDENKFNVYSEASGNVKIQNVSGSTATIDYGFVGVAF